MGTLKRFLKNVFENLGVVSTPLKCFQKWFLDQWRWSWRIKELVVFKRHWWSLSVRSEQFIRATTLPRNGTGLSSKFICFSAGSLTLYKGLWDPGIRVAARVWAIVNWDPSWFIRTKDTWVLPLWHWSYTRGNGGRLPGFAGEVNSTGQAPVLR
jgi:hypothetical protein